MALNRVTADHQVKMMGKFTLNRGNTVILNVGNVLPREYWQCL
jgi:hypothetical protein